MCRLSIIVPYERDEAAFETTLVSVLENRPESCEVIVSHDGGYQDPFDLSDEVKFVTAKDASPVSLLRTAIAAATGRVVHVMSGGARATENWTDAALAMFEQSDLGCVAPLIRNLADGNAIVAAGWQDTFASLRSPIAAGAAVPSRRDQVAIQGAYLTASFWRRGALQPLVDTVLQQNCVVLDYILSRAIAAAGWRIRLCPESNVVASPGAIVPPCGVMQTSSRVQWLRKELRGEKATRAVLGGTLRLLTAPLSTTAWAEAAGRVSAAFGSSGEARSIAREIRHVSTTSGPDAVQNMILKMPSVASSNSNYGSIRRVA